MRLRYWQRAWKNTSWLRLLYGATCDPSTGERGVAAFISSLPDTRASRSPSPADVVAWMTPGTSGPTSHESLTSAGQVGLFSRTSPAIYPSDLIPSAMSYTVWASGLRQAYSVRRKLALRTDASACSRLPTANAHDGRRPGPDDTSTQGANLKREAEAWQTPSVGAYSKRRQVGQTERAELLLPAQAAAWATPVAADCGIKVTPNSLQPGLILQPYEFGRPGHRMPKGGEKQAPNSGLRLNPAFVEWLMGWPHGWTDFAPVATGWSRWWRLMRSELSRLHWLDA